MSAKVSSFEKVKVGAYDYLFFLVAWNDYETSLKEELSRNFEKFGEHIGTEGLIVQAYDKDKWATGEQILEKDWGDLAARLQNEQEPFLLVIDTDFSKFDPKTDKWGIIWISDYFNDRNAIPRLFFSIQKKLKKGEDLFEHFNAMKNAPESNPMIKNGHGLSRGGSFLIADKAYVDGTLEKHCARIRKAVAEGNTEQGISFLKELKSRYTNEVLMLSNRLESIRLGKIRGTLSHDEETVALNRISYSVLDLIAKIEEEHQV